MYVVVTSLLTFSSLISNPTVKASFENVFVDLCCLFHRPIGFADKFSSLSSAIINYAALDGKRASGIVNRQRSRYF